MDAAVLLHFFSEELKRAQQAASQIDVSKIAVGTVAAHGFDIGTRGLVSSSSVFKHKAAGLIRQFLGAMAWAAAIGLGLMIYTHFTQKWRDSGYPAIPLDALTATHNPQGQIPSQSRASPNVPTGQVAGVLIDSWDC